MARRLVDQMNYAGPSKVGLFTAEDEHIDRIFGAWMSSQWEAYQIANIRQDEQLAFSVEPTALTMGYLTRDACPGIGDDIQHIPVPHSKDQP